MTQSSASDLEPWTLQEQQALNVPRFASPFLENLLEAESELSPEHIQYIRDYQQQGYVILDTHIPNHVLDGAVEDLQSRYQYKNTWVHGDGKRLKNGWMLSENVRHIATQRSIRDLLYLLYGREPIPFQTLNFNIGTQQPTHSDTIHFHCAPQRFMAGVWIALEDIDADNGPLHYYPQSHNLPIYELQHLGILGSEGAAFSEVYPQYERFLSSMLHAQQMQRKQLHIKKGQALIWSANLAHGGSAILDPTRSRHSQVTHYYFTDCAYYGPILSEPLLAKSRMFCVQNIVNGEEAPHYYGGRRVRPVARQGLQYFETNEAPQSPTLATQKPIRLLAWPRYEDPNALLELCKQFQQSFMRFNGQTALILRFDRPIDIPKLEVLEQLRKLSKSDLFHDVDLEIVVFDDDLPMTLWPSIQSEVTASIATKTDNPMPKVQQHFLKSVGAPIFESSEALNQYLASFQNQRAA